MSANMPGSFDPSNPFGSQKGGQFDPGALQGLYLRATKGDLAARKYLQSLGFLGDQGQDIWNPADTKAGDWGSGINAWAQSTGSTPYAGAGFQFNPGYINDSDPGFSREWDRYFQTGGAGTDFQPADTRAASPDPSQINPQGPSTQNTAAVSTFQAPNPNWSPWSLYGGKNNDGGYYNAGKDQKRWVNNGVPESDADRVWRWTLDDARKIIDPQTGQPIDAGAAQNQAQIIKIFLANVGRLRRDYEHPDNAALGGWGNSPFAGYTQISGSSTPAPGADPAKNPDGTPRVDPVTGKPVVPPVTTPPSATYTNPTTGAQTNYDPTSNSALLNLPLADPQNDDARLAYVMRKFGLDPTRAGLYTGSIARALSPQIEASSQLNGLYGDTNAVDTARSNLDNFVGTLSRPGGFGALQGQARGLLADPRLANLASGLGAPQQINTLQTLLSQAYAGGNAIYNQSRLGRFNQALGPGGEFAMQSLDNPALNDPLAWLQSTEWADMLRGY